MVSPVSGLRSRGGGVVPSGEAGDEASVEALSRRGVPEERDSESCAYGERACDVAVCVRVCMGSPFVYVHMRARPPPAAA